MTHLADRLVELRRHLEHLRELRPRVSGLRSDFAAHGERGQGAGGSKSGWEGRSWRRNSSPGRHQMPSTTRRSLPR